MKKAAALFMIIFLAPFSLCAKDAIFSGTDYTISLTYNDTSCPGDAVFIRMDFSDNAKSAKVDKTVYLPTMAGATLYLNDRELVSSSFFLLSESSSKLHHTYLAGIPLSSWWAQGNYHMTVTYSYEGGKQMEFNLPFSIISKEFNRETIALYQRNTNIKTDYSAERIKQIEKLNALLGTFDAAAVFQTAPFTPPTAATRRTSFFADRRVFEYTNGKSSTSLHYGTDYGIPTGTPVTACAAGKVVMAETRISTGWSVVIEHLPGLYSLYYHMSSLSVTEGDIVQSGATIGLSGATGLATGPHLHWEMRLNTCAVNPDLFTTDFAFSGKQPPAPFSRQPAEEINSPVEK